MIKKTTVILLSALVLLGLLYSCDQSENEYSKPAESLPAESFADISIPEESVPETSIPEESMPEESMPEESMPEESAEDEVSEEESYIPEEKPTVTVDLGLTENGFSIKSVDGVIYIDGILIANKTYALPQNYSPNGMTPETASAFAKMCADALNEGIYLFADNHFRSYELQNYLYTNFCNRDGKEQADRYSARPGHSEHQSGMAIDVNKANPDFNGTKEQIWLAENCAEYGFVIRYPEGKENVTGYMYESWHIRYVGRDLAEKLYLGNGVFMTIEEYFGITSVYEN